MKVCQHVRCGVDAHCYTRGHVASCECNSGTRGDPWSVCRKDECTVDEDCPAWLACRTRTCQDPCPGACALGALCNVVRHAPMCECPRGTVGNPTIECKPGNTIIIYVCSLNTSICFLFFFIPQQLLIFNFLVQPDYVGCSADAECTPGLACLQGSCKNPCDSTSCGILAVCRVANTLPFRTLICECPPPLTGDASIQCNPSKYIIYVLLFIHIVMHFNNMFFSFQIFYSYNLSYFECY